MDLLTSPATATARGVGHPCGANRLVNILSSLVCLPPPGPECGSGHRESLWGQVRGRVECFGIGRRVKPCEIAQLH